MGDLRRLVGRSVETGNDYYVSAEVEYDGGSSRAAVPTRPAPTGDGTEVSCSGLLGNLSAFAAARADYINNDQQPEQTFRALLDEIAREAAHSAWDAHQREIPAEHAWDLMTQLFYYTDDARRIGLPERMPAEFAHDFRRYTGLIQAGNQFMMDDRTP